LSTGKTLRTGRSSWFSWVVILAGSVIEDKSDGWTRGVIGGDKKGKHSSAQ
jgi:hypothetical protein